ncbi:MAG: UvrD-helicase domain-containing protein [Spirochaetia bacterium]
MADRRYLLLVNDALKTHLARLPAARRKQIREKLEFLENGMWDAGVRVKKLRGTPRVVFEARMSKGDRLLFTLGRHRDAVAIYLWGLVDHDGISAEARRIEPSNAPFLAFEELEHEDRAELVIEGLPAPYFTQESVEERVPDDYGPQRWLVFDDEEWGRLIASPDPASFEGFLHLTREQEELLASAPPVLVSGTAGSGKTTLSVYYLLRGGRRGGRRLFLTYNPLLKRMAERIYAGLVEKRVEESTAAPPRFALFREIALEAAGGTRAGFSPENEVGLQEFIAILHDHRDRNRIDAELAWEEIRSIIKGATVPLDPRRCAFLVEQFTRGAASAAERRELVDYMAGLRNLGIGRKAEAALERRSLFPDWDQFLAHLARPSDERAAPGLAALQAVADLVAKHPADFSRPLLALEDYLALGRKRAPNFHHDRTALHGVAVFYQERLERAGRWDEIDLARAALRTRAAPMPAAGVSAWDLVVCDEVQDLADVQIALLFRLAADPRSVVLTGDPRQIINPTGFRWEEVKYRFRERGLPVPEVRRLSLNFRCVGPIVRLANALLDLKASLVGLTDTEMRESWKFGGRPPFVLEGVAESELLARLAERGAGQVILARTAEEAQRLRKRLGTELVFTVAEAKGLEFDTVLLWRFAADEGADSVWRAIASGERPGEERLPHVRHELALLYVAVTRTRSTLLAWDGERPAPVWETPEIAPLVFRAGGLDRLSELWKSASTPAEWEAEGDYFSERERWAAAHECYRNAGAEAKLELAAAHVREADGDDAGAAPLYERRGETALAAACWERAGEWERAQRAWREAGEPRRALTCGARLAESRGRLEEAAIAWQDLGESARADSLWRRAGAFDRLARSARAAGEHGKAAELFERARMSREAAGAWEAAGEHERAGDLWLRLGDHAQAARLFRRAGSEEKLLRCLRHLGNNREAALLLEKRGEIEKAVDAFAAAVAESDEARRQLQSDVPPARTKRTALKAAIRLAALGRDAEAAPLFLKAGTVDAAARRYERAGDHLGLARCHEIAGRWLEAARELGSAPPGADRDEPRRAMAIQTLLYSHISAAREQGRQEREAEALLKEAERLAAQGNLVAALARFRLLGAVESVAEVSRALGWHEEAIDWMLISDNTSAALRYAEGGGFPVSLESFDRLAGRYLDDRRRSSKAFEEVCETLLHLLIAAAEPLPAEAMTEKVEGFFARAYGRFIFASHLPDAGLELLLRARASTPIMSLLQYELQVTQEPDARVLEFGERLSRTAEEIADTRLAACRAYFLDMRQFRRPAEGFESAAARLPVARDTVAILGRSRRRYREAVDLLMAEGAIDDAELYCRINHDHGLAAAWAEKRGDMKGALKYYREARDLDGALRCALASGDERTVARAREWRGEMAEALRIWKRLGRKADVARLLKKHPLLNN